MDEALQRAEAYRQAGADAVLIHSKHSRPDEILEFARQWDNRSPLVIVPTKYWSTPTEVFREHQISLVIWANHMIRAGIAAMQDAARSIAESESLVDIEGQIASVSEIFRLQGAAELLEAERRYAAGGRDNTTAVVLAASRGSKLKELTRDRPKVMIPVAGKPVLRRLVDKFKDQGINDIAVVAGYQHSAIDTPGIRLLINEDWDSTGELASLKCALDSMGSDNVILYGDLLFRRYILSHLLDWDAELLAVVDSSPLDHAEGNLNDLAWCTAVDDRAMYQQKVSVECISSANDAASKQPDRPPEGRWIGMLRVAGAGVRKLREAIDQLESQEQGRTLSIPDVINQLVQQGHAPQVQYINGHWMDINRPEDLQRAGEFAHDRDVSRT